VLNVVGINTEDVVKLLRTPGRDYFSVTPRLVDADGRAPSPCAPVALTSSPFFSAGPRGTRVTAAAEAGDEDVRPSSPETVMAEIRRHVQISGAPHKNLAVRSKTGQIVKAAVTAEDVRNLLQVRQTAI